MPTYTTSIYGANRPMGVAASPDGSRIYIGETQGDRTARVFDAAGTQLGLMHPRCRRGPTHVPVYLAYNPLTNEVYVSDRPTGSIYIYDPNGTYQRTFDPGAGPEGLAAAGHDVRRGRQPLCHRRGLEPPAGARLRPAGALIRTIGTTAGFNFPNGVAVDAAGNVYVTDGNNGRLVVFDATDTVIAQVGRGVGEGNLGLPRGVAIDAQRPGVRRRCHGPGRVRLREPPMPGETEPRVPRLLRGRGRVQRNIPIPQRRRGRCPGSGLRGRLRQRPSPGVELLRTSSRGGEPEECPPPTWAAPSQFPALSEKGGEDNLRRLMLLIAAG